MKSIGDKIKLPDGRRGTVVGVTVPIAAWKGANGRLMMEKKNRELEVEVANKDGSRSRVFLMEQEPRGLLVPILVAAGAIGAAALFGWLLFK